MSVIRELHAVAKEFYTRGGWSDLGRKVSVTIYGIFVIVPYILWMEYKVRRDLKKSAANIAMHRCMGIIIKFGWKQQRRRYPNELFFKGTKKRAKLVTKGNWKILDESS